jgi:hypothetical protein
MPWPVCQLFDSVSLVGKLKNPYLSLDMLSNSALFAGFVCILRLAVSTNCPTVALNPARNALNGYNSLSLAPVVPGLIR